VQVHTPVTRVARGNDGRSCLLGSGGGPLGRVDESAREGAAIGDVLRAARPLEAAISTESAQRLVASASLQLASTARPCDRVQH
jgi:hypothetical protein